MSTQKKSAKPLIVGIIAAVVILLVVLALLLTQCTGILGGGNAQSTTQPTETTAPQGAATYDLYWNLDRALYDGMSEAGMSSRQPAEDGYFHVRFFKDGEIVELKVADRKTVNSLEPKDLMGLEFDENGIVVGVIDIEDLPLEKVGWQFYVQSTGGKIIKVNSSNGMNGMEVMLETGDKTVGIWDMTGMSGEPGCEAEPGYLDRIYGIANEDGDLTHVFIYDRSEYMRTHEAECEHCGKVVTWNEWTKDNKIPLTSGHYQLQNDVQTTAQSSMPVDCKICLDLNGYKIDGADGKRIYSLHNQGAELALMDTSEEKTGKIVAHGSGDQGLCVWVRYGAFYLYDGILDASEATTTKSGTTVAVVKGAFFYMNGGELIGGNSMWTKNETTGKYGAGVAGTVHVAGKMVINDGVIRDGYAKYVKYVKDGKDVYERGIGGNIFVTGTGVLEMNGGVIKNGKARVAGNIYMDGAAEFTMNGGKIQNGRNLVKGTNGGNLYIGSKAKFTMNGGTISGGTTRNTAGNVYMNGTFIMNGGVISGGKCLDATTGKANPNHASRNLYNVNGKFYMYGGRIYGGVAAIDTKGEDKSTATVLLSGYAKIKGSTEGAPNLSLLSYNGGENVKLKVGKMLSGSSVGVTTAYGIFSEKCAEHNTDNFFSDIEGAEVIYYDGRLALGTTACLCGSNSELPEEHIGKCDGTKLFWGPWSATNSLPNTEGNYYLINDVTSGGQKSIGSTDNGDVTVNLNLNGKKVDTAGRTYLVYGNLNIVDHVGGGVLSGKGPSNGTDHTATILQGGNSVVSLYSGTIGISKNHYNVSNAGCVGIGGTSEFIMYGGTVDGSNAQGERTVTETTTGPDGEPIVTETTVVTTVKNGGAIRNSGKFTMYDGEVIGGTVTGYGAAIYIEKTAKAEIHGGTVTGGTAVLRAGSIYLAGTSEVTMKGGEIVGGTNTTASNNGGSIFIESGATFNLEDGTISGGTSANIGGNIYANGTLKISGGLVTGGKVYSDDAEGNSANIACVNIKLLEISGGQIDGYVGVTDTKDNGSTIKLSGKPSITGGKINLTLTSIQGAIRPTVTIEGELEDGAMVGIAKSGVFSTATVEANIDNFSADDGTSVVLMDDNDCLMIGEENMPYYHCLCGSDTDKHIGDCDGKKLLWEPWDGKSNLKTPGNYYLSGSVTGGSQKTIGTSGKNDDVYNICLNGQSISSNSRAYLVYGKVSFTDHTGEGSITGKGLTSTNHSGVVLVGGGSFSLYGGTLKLADDHNTVTQAGVIGGGYSATINIYGGVVDGRSADETNTINYGGAIRTNGILNITGGKIYGGDVENYGGAIYALQATDRTNTPTVNISGGEIIGGTAGKGGAIYIGKSSALVMSGGTVRDGATEVTTAQPKNNNGGNIYLEGTASFNLSGGTIKDGSTVNASGNIYCGAPMTMTGGLITGGIHQGSKEGTTANLHIVDNVLTMTGGQIDGYVTVHANSKNASAVMSGSARITGGKQNLRFYAASGKTMPTVTINGELNDDFLVGITCSKVTDPEFVFATAGTGVTLTEDDCEHFYGDAGYSAILTEDKTGMKFQEGGVKVACLCGGRLEASDVHAHEYLLWEPWESNNSLPATSGSYYLTTDVTLGAEVNWKSEITLNLDLNDKTITGWSETAKRVFRLNDGDVKDNSYNLVLNITDNGTETDKEGTITTTRDGDGERGAIIWITEKTQTVSIYGGVIDATKVSMAADQPGAAIAVGRGTLNIYGGTIKGGTVKGDTSNTNSGGAIYIDKNDNGGTVNMYGGKVIGGDAMNGGAVSIFATDNNAVFNMQGGTIEKGTSDNSGGAIFVNGGTVTIGGTAKVDGGSTKANGGNIYVAAGTVRIEGKAQIINGKAQNTGTRRGGNIAIGSGEVTLAGEAEIKDGKSTSTGGNVYITSSGSFVVEGGKISGGYGQSANHAASNVYNMGGDFTMSGGEISGYVMAHNNSDTDNATVTISGTAKITGGVTNLRLYAAAGKTPIAFNIDTMKTGAAVGVTFNSAGVKDGDVISKGIKAEADASYFTSDEASKYTLVCQKTANADTYELVYKLAVAATSVTEEPAASLVPETE